MNLEPLEPPRWAQSGHAQTILAHLLPSPRPKNQGKRVEIPLPDGDKLVAFVRAGHTHTVVYLFHGLSGSTESDYIQRSALVAERLGHTTIMTNHRGCGAGAGLAKGAYHSGRGEDLSAVIAYGRMLFPSKRHVAIGFSLSGNAILLLASGQRGDVPPDSVISVNAPIELEKAGKLLQTGLNRIYDIRFYRQCRRDILASPIGEEWRDRIPQLISLYDFDNIYTAPVGGFKNREDYYQTCSAQPHLSKINVPTILITAKDDPFVPYESYEKAQLSPSIHLHVEDFGGHMGYLHHEKTPLGTIRWQDYALHQALLLT